ncbi:MAG: leucine--tRNA ligase [Nitrospiraceae bacterium]|nr:leucine--tRNA ligase [Nitrospiraceae bacterium]
MKRRYQPGEVELKWQALWSGKDIYRSAPDARPKFYCLEMFPYPSGKIHMGHVRNYAIGDVIARYKRMRGFNVLHPMGWDAFGLPAENAAIKEGVHPARWTHDNIAYMKKQLIRLGLSYDWGREVATCDPAYYRWNQWFFLKMFEKGLAYRKASFVNWCPSCATVLANEQVIDGSCWRCESVVVQKELEQWFLRITAYEEELLAALDGQMDGQKLSGWPEKVLLMQKNWIGRSEGLEIAFPVEGSHDEIPVFTTRADTLFGAKFICLAPKHPVAEKFFAADRGALEKISEHYGKMEEKQGLFTGHYVINPVNGERLPVYVANFVLMEYGTGAIMSVPAHDQRDFEFAQLYGLPLKVVIRPEAASGLPTDSLLRAFEDDGVLVDSGPFSGLASEEARRRIAEYIEAKGSGRRVINYRLRDWGVSRQRYWGTPIPIIYCERCGIVPVPEKDLPVVLPEDVKFTGKGGSPLVLAEDFINVDCPGCGGRARRETDTMDTFVDSSWYYVRYCSGGDEPALDKANISYYMPADQYVGGVEHAVLHLLYSRFFMRVIRDLGFTSISEPFQRLLTQGMVCMETIRCPEHGWLYPSEVENERCTRCGRTVERGRTEKMSKSKRNTVDPDQLIKTYGADTARLFSLFAAPPERDLEWSEKGVEGVYRFLQRIFTFVYDNLEMLTGPGAAVPAAPVIAAAPQGPPGEKTPPLIRKTHQTIMRVTRDIEREYHFNTAIAAMMELVNAITALAPEGREGDAWQLRFAVEKMLLLLAPFCPHLAQELWEAIGMASDIQLESWPGYAEDAAREEQIELVVQVNGKVRAKIMVPQGLTDEDIKARALSEPRIKETLTGKDIKNVFAVKGKLVNIVAR